VDRLKVREQIKGATQPLLLRGEFIRACGRARAREYGRRRPLISRGVHCSTSPSQTDA
jgi:hypothetical protein